MDDGEKQERYWFTKQPGSRKHHVPCGKLPAFPFGPEYASAVPRILRILMTTNISSLASLIWSVADLLRGDFKQSQYGRIILPFTVLRRLECVLAPSKTQVLAMVDTTKTMPELAKEKLLLNASGHAFYNSSPLELAKLGETHVGDNLDAYVRAFSKDAREIFEHFNFDASINLLEDADLLYKVVRSFANVDLSPEAVDNYHMGLVFEELIRRFAESSNETAGEHFTPRDIVRLTTSLVFAGDDEALGKPGIVRSIYDPTAGTGGFLSCGMEYLHELNPAARLATFGQELNPESYAICKADMLIKGQEISNIKLGNTLSDDQLPYKSFDYCLSNPPFGVDWKKVEKQVRDEATKQGFNGRFGPGLPRVSDGSLLFLMHLIAKMQQPTAECVGSKIGIILNGSPLVLHTSAASSCSARWFTNSLKAGAGSLTSPSSLVSCFLNLSRESSLASENWPKAVRMADCKESSSLVHPLSAVRLARRSASCG